MKTNASAKAHRYTSVMELTHHCPRPRMKKNNPDLIAKIVGHTEMTTLQSPALVQNLEVEINGKLFTPGIDGGVLRQRCKGKGKKKKALSNY